MESRNYDAYKESDRRAANCSEQELSCSLRDRERARYDCGYRKPVGDERHCVIQQPFAFEDADDGARHAQ